MRRVVLPVVILLVVSSGQSAAQTGAAADPTTETEPQRPIPERIGADPRGFLLERMRILAESGRLADPEFVSATLGIALREQSARRLSNARCGAKSPATERTDLTRYAVTGESWFKSLPGAAATLRYPDKDGNPAFNSAVSPELAYQVIVMISCPGTMALDKETSVLLEFRGLPAFSCIRSVDDHLPAAAPSRTADGVTTILVQGKHDDVVGTELTFYFRSGDPCAVAAAMVQEDRLSYRFQRTAQKHRACLDSARVAYCVSHKSTSRQDQSQLKEIISEGVARCGHFADAFRDEPLSGQPPASGPVPNSYHPSPCD